MKPARTPSPTPLSPRVSAWLDFIRGMAALTVLVGHVRGIFFMDYRDLKAPSPLLSALYAATGLGHQAVMVFFVLSGFFIGGSVLSARHNWSWKSYLVNRFTRLYLVLIPALCLTALSDFFAKRQPGGHTYFDLLIPHFYPEPLAGHGTVPIFLGNLAFLQKFFVPPFGSNDPLWSISFEFWFYILFPLLLLASSTDSRPVRRVSCIVAVAAGAWALPPWMVTPFLGGFLFWCLGVSIHFIPEIKLPAAARWTVQALCLALFVGSLALSRIPLGRFRNSDAVIAFTFALFAASLIRIPAPRLEIAPVFARFAKLIAGCSYSVYAVHFPLLLLIRTSITAPVWQPDAGNLTRGAVIALVLCSAGYVFSRLTEANNESVRARVSTLVGLPTRHPAHHPARHQGSAIS